jgi:hypothetical protein
MKRNINRIDVTNMPERGWSSASAIFVGDWTIAFKPIEVTVIPHKEEGAVVEVRAAFKRKLDAEWTEITGYHTKDYPAFNYSPFGAIAMAQEVFDCTSEVLLVAMDSKEDGVETIEVEAYSNVPNEHGVLEPIQLKDGSDPVLQWLATDMCRYWLDTTSLLDDVLDLGLFQNNKFSVAIPSVDHLLRALEQERGPMPYRTEVRGSADTDTMGLGSEQAADTQFSSPSKEAERPHYREIIPPTGPVHRTTLPEWNMSTVLGPNTGYLEMPKATPEVMPNSQVLSEPKEQGKQAPDVLGTEQTGSASEFETFVTEDQTHSGGVINVTSIVDNGLDVYAHILDETSVYLTHDSQKGPNYPLNRLAAMEQFVGGNEVTFFYSPSDTNAVFGVTPQKWVVIEDVVRKVAHYLGGLRETH